MNRVLFFVCLKCAVALAQAHLLVHIKNPFESTQQHHFQQPSMFQRQYMHLPVITKQCNKRINS